MINKHYDMKQDHTFYLSFLVYSIIYNVKIKKNVFETFRYKYLLSFVFQTIRFFIINQTNPIYVSIG
jgi:hypothetical protein